MKIEDQAFGVIPEEMQAIDTDTGLHIKKIFPERDIIFELEILL